MALYILLVLTLISVKETDVIAKLHIKQVKNSSSYANSELEVEHTEERITFIRFFACLIASPIFCLNLSGVQVETALVIVVT